MNIHKPMVLAYDTSTEIFQARLRGPGEDVLIEERQGLRHAEQVAEAAAKLLEICPLSEIDVVAWTRGPGSFTGLRIGAAFCKGLCAGQDSPKLVSIPTLEAMVRSFRDEHESHADYEEKYLLPCIDGKKQRYYLQLFTSSGHILSPVIDADHAQTQELLSKQNILPENVRVLGPHADSFRIFAGSERFLTGLNSGCSAGTAELAAEAFLRGEFDRNDQGPEYYRLSQAEEGK